MRKKFPRLLDNKISKLLNITQDESLKKRLDFGILEVITNQKMTFGKFQKLFIVNCFDKYFLNPKIRYSQKIFQILHTFVHLDKAPAPRHQRADFSVSSHHIVDYILFVSEKKLSYFEKCFYSKLVDILWDKLFDNIFNIEFIDSEVEFNKDKHKQDVIVSTFYQESILRFFACYMASKIMRSKNQFKKIGKRIKKFHTNLESKYPNTKFTILTAAFVSILLESFVVIKKENPLEGINQNQINDIFRKFGNSEHNFIKELMVILKQANQSQSVEEYIQNRESLMKKVNPILKKELLIFADFYNFK